MAKPVDKKKKLSRLEKAKRIRDTNKATQNLKKDPKTPPQKAKDELFGEPSLARDQNSMQPFLLDDGTDVGSMRIGALTGVNQRNNTYHGGGSTYDNIKDENRRKLRRKMPADRFQDGGTVSKKQIPEGPKGKGLRALKAKAPEVAANMGYKHGGAVTVKTNQKPHMS